MMTLRFRFGFAIALLSSFAAVAPFAAHAQSWPSRPLKLVSPFPPGGSTDILARLIAPKLSEAYKQSVIVENRPGAGGVVGSDLVAKSPPDGYTLLISSIASQVIAPVVQKTPYEPLRDFTHIALLGGPPTAFAVGPALSNVKDLKAFIALAKAKPNAIGYA
ncbi:MAG: tripartite tricarboxylate transporter substrate binding protein, partial [Betaproteobacteria bacterium]|nr:tripartite tricarboxylate transporter substrate binding protein [Betaproteobacteria bacterium]